MKTTIEFCPDGVLIFEEKYSVEEDCNIVECLGKFTDILAASRQTGCQIPWDKRIWGWQSYADCCN